MIDKELRDRIEPNLKMHLPRDQWAHINEMFSECYVTNIKGKDLITLKPVGIPMAMQFLALTGAFVEITDWNYIKTKGTLI